MLGFFTVLFPCSSVYFLCGFPFTKVSVCYVFHYGKLRSCEFENFNANLCAPLKDKVRANFFHYAKLSVRVRKKLKEVKKNFILVSALAPI